MSQKFVCSTSPLKFSSFKKTIKVKILPNITKFYRVDLRNRLLCIFRRHICLCNLKHALSLTARKTVFSLLMLHHANCELEHQFFISNVNIIKNNSIFPYYSPHRINTVSFLSKKRLLFGYK